MDFDLGEICLPDLCSLWDTLPEQQRFTACSCSLQRLNECLAERHKYKAHNCNCADCRKRKHAKPHWSFHNEKIAIYTDYLNKLPQEPAPKSDALNSSTEDNPNTRCEPSFSLFPGGLCLYLADAQTDDSAEPALAIRPRNIDPKLPHRIFCGLPDLQKRRQTLDNDKVKDIQCTHCFACAGVEIELATHILTVLQRELEHREKQKTAEKMAALLLEQEVTTSKRKKKKSSKQKHKHKHDQKKEPKRRKALPQSHTTKSNSSHKPETSSQQSLPTSHNSCLLPKLPCDPKEEEECHRGDRSHSTAEWNHVVSSSKKKRTRRKHNNTTAEKSHEHQDAGLTPEPVAAQRHQPRPTRHKKHPGHCHYTATKEHQEIPKPKTSRFSLPKEKHKPQWQGWRTLPQSTPPEAKLPLPVVHSEATYNLNADQEEFDTLCKRLKALITHSKCDQHDRMRTALQDLAEHAEANLGAHRNCSGTCPSIMSSVVSLLFAEDEEEDQESGEETGEALSLTTPDFGYELTAAFSPNPWNLDPVHVLRCRACETAGYSSTSCKHSTSPKL